LVTYRFLASLPPQHCELEQPFAVP